MVSKKTRTTRHSNSSTFRRWDVVTVPFPFNDQLGAKRRPALVLSNVNFNRHGQIVLSMITTSGHYPWPGDDSISDLKTAGLTAPSLVRLKVFTLDLRLIAREIGRLSSTDQQLVQEQIKKYLSW